MKFLNKIKFITYKNLLLINNNKTNNIHVYINFLI